MKQGPEVRMQGVCKSFGSTKALLDVDFIARPGKVNAIIGENGAGKSTLMKLLFGLLKADSGEIQLDGKTIAENYNPSTAIHAGLGMLQQHFCLIPEFTVLENLILGKEPSSGVQIDFKEGEKKLRKILDSLNCEFSLETRINELSVPQCQLVEIARMLYTGARLMIFDEPTASLAPQEVENLYALLGDLSGKGATIILITHRLGEVMKHADFVTVLRKGKVSAGFDRSDMTEEKLIHSIIDDESGLKYSRPSKLEDVENNLFIVNELSCINRKDQTVLENVNFSLRRGEVFGIAGVTGSGQKELAEALLGVNRAGKGEILLEGGNITQLYADKRRKSGVAYIPEDRFADGVISQFSLVLNCLLGEHREKRRRSTIGYDYPGLRNDVFDKINNYQIRAEDPSLPLSSMSGGNQQKLMLARELDRRPKLVIAHGPTRGLDVAASTRCYEKIMDLVNSGTSVILFSTELDDLLRYSHRIGVLYGGKLINAGESASLTSKQIGLLMTRGTDQEAANVN